MKWVTRARPKVDRIACPWLILRFIDQEAEIVYLPPEQVLAAGEREDWISFDAPGARFDHVQRVDGSQWCTFETLIDAYDLGGVPGLTELASIVHAADISSDSHAHPFGAAVRALGEAGSLVEADDDRLLGRALFVYDALYAYCCDQVERRT